MRKDIKRTMKQQNGAVLQRRRVVRQQDGSLREIWEDVGMISAMAAPAMLGMDVGAAVEDIGDLLGDLF